MTLQNPRLSDATNSAASDEQLLDHARSGDRQALNQLLARYQGRVFRFSMKMCRTRQDAEDVLQETLIALARGVQDFRGASSISTWLYTIARSFCIKKHRRSKFAPHPEQSLEASRSADILNLTDAGRAPDESLAEKQIEQALEQAIRSLEPHYREVLILRDVEGLTAPQVAEVLKISQQAVKSRLHRARIAVRNQIAPLLGIPQPGAPLSASCPDMLTLFSRHLENEISQDICVKMEQHLAGCPHCRTTCNSLKHTLALCKTPKRRFRLSYKPQ